MNDTLKQYAFRAGIQFDAFGSPVVDHPKMLQQYAEALLTMASLLAAEEMTKPKKQQGNIETIIKEKFGLK